MKRKYVIASGVVIILLLLISTAALARDLGKLANPELMDTPITDSSPVLVAQPATGMSGMRSGMSSISGTNAGMRGVPSGSISGTNAGMGVVNVDTAQSNGRSAWLSNPWLMLGWSFLGVVVLTILFGIGSGIFWFVRQASGGHAQHAAPVQKG